MKKLRSIFVSSLLAIMIGLLGVPTAAFAGTSGVGVLATGVSVKGVYSVPVKGEDPVKSVNYIVLQVDNNDFAGVTYTINENTVTPSEVLSNSGTTKYIKLEVPSTVSGDATVATSGASANISETVNIPTAGIGAPATFYGTTKMNFSEFFHDVTANITNIHPQTMSFATSETVANPALFIAQGTRTGNLYPDGITWANSKNYPNVDAVSTATFGDGGVHYSVSKAHQTSEGWDNINSTGTGHALTGIKAVEVGVDFGLYANAEILKSLDEATDQSTAVLNKINAISIKPASDIYKAKYLFPDASWGARDTTQLNEAEKSFPEQTTPTYSYGNSWTTRQLSVNFDLATQSIGAEAFWDNYLEYIYGGYVENKSTGEKQPLVWLQNLFSHRMHVNFDVSLNDSNFPRFADLGSPAFPGNYKVVVFAEGFEDIVVDNQRLKAYTDGNAAIEQGNTFYVNPDDASTWFEDTGDTYELHVSGADQSTLTSFDANTAILKKGNATVDTSKYQFSKDGNEIALAFDDSFFTGDFQGSYTIALVQETADSVSKPLTFTVNKLVPWPSLSAEGGAQNVNDANALASPIKVQQGKKISISNDAFAKAILTSGRGTISSVSDLTNPGTTVPVAEVLKRNSTADPYHIDTTALTLGHKYQLDLVASNYAVSTGGNTKSTTLSYFISVEGLNLSNATVKAISAKTYTGKAQTPAPTLTHNGKTLNAGTHYRVSHSNNVKAGTAKVTIVGIGEYTGTKTVTYKINAASLTAKNTKASFSKIKSKKYSAKSIKKGIKPKLTIKAFGKTLKNGTDYKVSYKKNTKKGTASLTIKGKGNFSGSKTIKYTIK